MDNDKARRLVTEERATYGTCEVCGDAIPDERLEALPAARYCLDHQAAHERAGAADTP